MNKKNLRIILYFCLAFFAVGALAFGAVKVYQGVSELFEGQSSLENDEDKDDETTAPRVASSDWLETTPASTTMVTWQTTAKPTESADETTLVPETTTAEETTASVAATEVPETSTEEVPAVDLPRVGDIITLGTYPQDEDGTAKPIEWIVLAVEDGKALLISRYGLDAKLYNEEYTEVTWETCTLRTWLNEEFYNEAFEKSEQGKIENTLIINRDNPTYGTPGGNDITDKIFMLSLDETLQYFDLTKNNGEKNEYIYCYGDDVCCQPTAWALSRGAWQYKWDTSSGEEYRRYDGNCDWWLRSPGEFNESAACVGSRARVYGNGYNVNYNLIVVRPALWYNPNP